MIQPNFDLLLWIILISIGINAISKITLGATHTEKHTHYGVGDAIGGLIEMFIVLWVIFK